MSTRDQASTRVVELFEDQHGRKWDVTLDTKNLKFCTPPIPLFREPMPVPLKYVKHGTRLGMLRIDYDEWIADNGGRRDEIEQTLVKLAADMEPNRTAEAMDNPTASMIRILGGNVLPLDIVLAKKAGSRWALGIPNPQTGEPEQPPRWFTPALEAQLAAHLGTAHRTREAQSQDLSRFRDDDDETELEPELDPRLEAFLDVEESADPQAVGGKRNPVTPPRGSRNGRGRQGNAPRPRAARG